MRKAMRALRGLVICENPELRARIVELLYEHGEVDPAVVLQHYPERREAARHITMCRPELVLLAIERLPAVIDILRELDMCLPGTPVIGISRLRDPRALAELMRLGVRDCITAPLRPDEFCDAVHRLAYQRKAAMEQEPVEPLVCFLPVRGGSGTSTLACNISYRLSRQPGAHVLFLDLDLSAGLSRFAFRLSPSCSLSQLVANGRTLDDDNWRQCLMISDHLHIIPGGRMNPRQPFTAEHMRHLMETLSRKYTAICADLTGSLETYSLELLRRARHIVLVSTTERPSIEMAREKVQFLKALELTSRASVALTRSPDTPSPDVAAVGTVLGVDVEAVFDFSEKRVRQCLGEGSLIHPKTTLSRQLDQYTAELGARLAAAPRTPLDRLKV